MHYYDFPGKLLLQNIREKSDCSFTIHLLSIRGEYKDTLLG